MFIASTPALFFGLADHLDRENQLLFTQIPKAQKDSQVFGLFCSLLVEC
jgi:hypothetical protein